MWVWLGPVGGIVVVAALAAGIIYFQSPFSNAAAKYTEAPNYVGTAQCVRCHRLEGQAWEGSHHDLAMKKATPETVRGDFSGVSVTHYGVTSRMFRQGEKYLVATEGRDGKIKTFEVKYTFGVEPLQQYLVEFPDGRLQALSVAWDTEKQEWFLLDPEDERILPGDPLHWTEQAMNWNHMCADCHSTGVKKNYDLKTDTFQTSWHEINVSCESCHGPGSHHVELAEAMHPSWDGPQGYGLPKFKGKEKAQQLLQIETCAKCHSRRARNLAPSSHGGDRYLDHYLPALLDDRFFDEEGQSDWVYHCDGQLRPEHEGYVYGSFLQSKMYRKGIRCTDCHDPHTTKVLAPGNKLCTRCHTPGKYDTPLHHFHEVNSKGSLCVECHMPETTYMEVDPRRDHSIRIPRPDLSVQLGTPNACNQCHTKKEETPQWAAAAVEKWYGESSQVKQRPEHFGVGIHAGRENQPGAASKLIKLLNRDSGEFDVGPFVRASAAALLGQQPDRPADRSKIRRALARALDDPEPLVRYGALRALQNRGPQERRRALSLLTDPFRAVRITAATAVAAGQPVRVPAELQDKLDKAIQEFQEGLLEAQDQPGAHYELGQLAYYSGDVAQAVQHYQNALKINPQFYVAREQLAATYEGQQNPQAAEKVLREGLEVLPDHPENNYALGLVLAHQPQGREEALQLLAKAVQEAPDRPVYRYNYGLLLHQAGQAAQAVEQLTQAVKADQGSVRAWHALALAAGDAKKPELALGALNQAAGLMPKDPTFPLLAGDMLIAVGKWEQAQKQLEQCLKLGSRSPMVFHGLALALEQQDQKELARQYASQAVQLAPRNPLFRSTLARLQQEKEL